METDTSNKNVFIGIAVLVVFVIGALGIGWYSTNNAGTANTEEEPVITQEQTTDDGLSGLEVGESTNNGEYTIERLPDNESTTLATPNLDRAVPATSPDITGNARTQAIVNMNGLITQLKADPSNFLAWLQLGVYRNILGDYQGAEEAWIYLTKKYPTDWQAFQNLADLYMTRLSNIAKAETYLKLAVPLRKDNEELYRMLYTVYTQEKKSTEAVAILKQGVDAIPQATDLVILLAREYRTQGQIELAKAEYDVAIARAQTSGNTMLAAELEAEKAAL